MKKVKVQIDTNSHVKVSNMESAALEGISTILGVSKVSVISAKDGKVELSYQWNGEKDYEITDEHLANYGLKKVWLNEE